MIVALSVAITLGLGLILTRRAVQDATLQDLAHQAALIVGEERSALSPLTHLPQLRPYLAQQHERYILDPAVLPQAARRELAADRPATGGVTIDGTAYYFAAEPVGRRAFILLRPKSLTHSALDAVRREHPDRGARRRPAGRRGGLPARAPDRASGGPRRRGQPEPREREAVRTGPGRGRGRAGDARGVLQRPRRAAGRAREAERSFLLSVSHELKTPLTAIAGYAEALREGAVGAERGRRDDRRSRPSGSSRLVGDLLDLARMNRTEFSVHTTEIDLAEVADDAVAALPAAGGCVRGLAGRRPDGPAPAVADADRVLQVVSNLVENALRLTPPGGEVRVVSRARPAARGGHGAGPRRRRTATTRSSASTCTRATAGAAGRYRARAGDREGADPGDGRERRGRERSGHA